MSSSNIRSRHDHRQKSPHRFHRRRDSRSPSLGRRRSRSRERNRRSRTKSRSRSRDHKKRDENIDKNRNSEVDVRGNINHSKKNSIKCDNVPDESRMVEEDFNESDFKEINDFIDETVDEEELLKQLEIDRKKRREEILKKYAESHSSGDISIEQPIQSIAPSEIFKDENETYVATNRVDTLEDDAHEVERLVAERQAIEMESAQEKTLAFDIFSSSPTEINDGTNFNKRPERGRQASRAALLEGENPHLQSDWDDGEGYYKTRVGEVLADRYRTTGEVGRGVFSTVLRCADIAAGTAMGTSSGQHPHVVLKLIRNNDVMRKAAEKEVSLLGMISSADEEGKKHCVRMLSTFEYRHHTVIVFEAMHMNLRETLKKFGKNVGINVSAVRLYGRQLLVALRHLASLQIVHADIKPDNIVVSEDLKQVKLCDFGSAFRESDPDNDPTPYLVSRFYRSPEIMLGMRYDRMLDLWSVAVCLYELFTGHVMFPGRSNNEMLKLQMEVKGRLPNKLIRSHLRAYETLQLEPFFDSNDLRFRYYEQDPVTGKAVLRHMDISGPTRDLGHTLLSSKAGADDRVLVTQLTDLLEKCLSHDPTKRCSVNDALKHPFFTGSLTPGGK